jgi:cytochrome c553
MEGGYVPPDLAPDIACYVMELGGHRCPHPYSRKAQMYFSSVCAGCHGLDGKGLHGSYPDLTRPTLLGIERRKETLQCLIHP